MHTDPALSAASSKTAERGLKVLKSLLDESDAAKNNCKAIYCAAVAELKGEGAIMPIRPMELMQNESRYASTKQFLLQM